MDIDLVIPTEEQFKYLIELVETDETMCKFVNFNLHDPKFIFVSNEKIIALSQISIHNNIIEPRLGVFKDFRGKKIGKKCFKIFRK